MAITKVKETRRSKEISTTNDTKKARREYVLWYADSANEADQYVETNLIAPIIAHDGTELLISTIDLRPNDKDQRIYTAQLDFSSAAAQERSGIGDEVVSFDLSSQTVKQLVSQLTVNKYASGGVATDHKGSIGVERDTIQGADVYVEQFSFSITKVLPNASITNAYISQLRDAAFRWNAVAFRGQAVGECLFVGVSGSPRDRKTYTLTYKFLCSKNKSNFTLGGVSGISKQGWDYLWAQFRDVEDVASSAIAKVPYAVYVERLYSSANFQAALGLA